jgi:hypothetical protein
VGYVESKSEYVSSFVKLSPKIQMNGGDNGFCGTALDDTKCFECHFTANKFLLVVINRVTLLLML